MIKISLVLPFRKRLNLFRTMLDTLVKNTWHCNEIEVLVAVDDDDEPVLAEIEEFEKNYAMINLKFYVVKQSDYFTRDYVNFLAKKAKGRWILAINDDCEFETEKWDKEVYEKMEKKADKTGDDIWIGLCWDGIRRKGENPLLPHFSCWTVVSKEAVDYLGYLWDERCWAWGPDHIISQVYKEIDRRVSLQDVKIEHNSRHCGRGSINDNYKKFARIEKEHPYSFPKKELRKEVMKLKLYIAQKERKMKIYLFNDTSTGHPGSRATMAYIYHWLSQLGEIIGAHKVHELGYNKAAFNLADTIIVNGEGTIHHNAKAGNFLMDMLEKGQREGKRTCLINAVFQQEPPYCKKILQDLDIFWVREELSYENARDCGGNPDVKPDLSANYVRWKMPDFSTQSEGVPRFVVYGNDWYGRMHGKVSLEWPFEDFVKKLHRKQWIYVTGQHHGVYAAALAGVPFIPVKSNSHKIEGLIKWSGFPIHVFNHPDEITPETIDKVRENYKLYREFSEWLYSKI